jgi:predicted Zn-dependent peptidase
VIRFEKRILDNGLKVIVHEDPSSPMAAVNIAYNVGSKDEDPDKTGFAHLFEHLMFGGSANIRDFDGPIQSAGGENNAFTNNDMTNFYEILPAGNVETALWLESDRMLKLNFSKKNLSTQKKVVIEEFKETCLNEPYGDMWHHMSALAYSVHPYRWPTIGIDISHIANATSEDVESFFYNFYRPGNAVLSVAGNVKAHEIFRMAEKWFGDIPSGTVRRNVILPEPPQTAKRQRILHAKVPNDAIYMAFHMGGRLDKSYFAADILSDALANGRSSRFFLHLFKEKQLFSTIDAFISGSVDPGLFLIEGKPMPGVSIEKASQAIWEELETIKSNPVEEDELQKLKNSIESSLIFSEVNVLNKAISLAYFETLGDASLIDREPMRYAFVTAGEIQDTAKAIFRPENLSELIYIAS